MMLLFLILQLIFIFVSYCDKEQPHQHRVRRFLFTKDSKVIFDFKLNVPFLDFGGINIETVLNLPFTITMLNDSFVFTPINIPYYVLPEHVTLPSNYPAFIPNNYDHHDSYIKYYYDDNNNNHKAMTEQQLQHHPQQQQQQQPPNQFDYNTIYDYYNQKKTEYHHMMRRSIGTAATQHRYDLFSAISQILNSFGIDGDTCISKAICQMAHSTLLVASPIEEILEHILTVSRGNDEEALLEQYLSAENYGRSGGNCVTHYSTCPFTLFEAVED